MFQTFWHTEIGGTQITEDTAYEVYSALVAAILGLCATIFGMWLLNAFMAKEVNYFFFFIGGFLLLIKGFKPPVVGASAIGGVGLHFLADKDLSQGAIKGLQVLYKVVTGVLFGFWVLAGLLSTWSFKEAPGAFWPIAAMALTIGITIEFFNMKGGVFKWVVIIYAVGVICTAFWQTFPKEWKSVMTPATPVATVPRVVPAPSWVGVVQTLNLTMGEWTAPIRLQIDRSVCWWGKNPDGKAFRTEVRGINDPTWYEASEFRRLQKEGRISYNFGWIRFKGLEPEAVAMYEYRQPGQCE